MLIIVECLWDYSALKFIETPTTLLNDSNEPHDEQRDAVGALSFLDDDYTEE